MWLQTYRNHKSAVQAHAQQGESAFVVTQHDIVKMKGVQKALTVETTAMRGDATTVNVQQARAQSHPKQSGFSHVLSFHHACVWIGIASGMMRLSKPQYPQK